MDAQNSKHAFEWQMGDGLQSRVQFDYDDDDDDDDDVLWFYVHLKAG